LKRNKIGGARFERAIKQILEFFVVEKEMNFLFWGLACIFGGIVGCDIKDCYHYIFALYNKVPFLVSRDRDFKQAIGEFNESIATDVEARKRYQDQMTWVCRNVPLTGDSALKEHIIKGIEILCDPNKMKIDLKEPEEMVDFLRGGK
jgi:hypothetical protein